MPMTSTGLKIMARMMKQYGAKKGKRVFYAMEHEGTLTPKAFVKKRKKRGRRK